MKLSDFPDEIRPYLVPSPGGKLVYRCLDCQEEYGIERLLYTCPGCNQVLLLQDKDFQRLRDRPAALWHRIFDYRKMLGISALKGIFRYHEFIGPVIPLDAVVYLGEGHTPMIEGNANLQEKIGLRFFFKNDGQNPSASFKDRGMASALSYIHFLIDQNLATDVLAVCASTGDTSAAAALYAAYLHPLVKSAVLLPHKKVTPQQLSQPLGSGAAVFEIPGVFDDCMKVVERLSEQYPVALLNSKNAWRILGQESYAYEICQELEYDLRNVAVVLPVGNAGNLTAVMSGFIKFLQTGLIAVLPKIIGVQSRHANPVFRYYRQKEAARRRFKPVDVKPSVAQAAMIGNPVSMPRVIHLVKQYDRLAGRQQVFFVEVTEQAIMDWQLPANRNGHIACTHGGESMAGLSAAIEQGCVSNRDIAVLDSTAHALKFAGFQQMYFDRQFPPEFEIAPDRALINTPVLIHPPDVSKLPSPGNPLKGKELDRYVTRVADEIATRLKLKS